MRARFSAWTFGLLLFAVLCTGTGMYLSPPDVIRVGAFSEASPNEQYPPGWSLFEMAPGHTQTRYDLVESAVGTAVRARSQGGLSSLYTESRIDLSTHPILEWRWKIDRLAKTDVTKKSRNDVTAGIVVTFAHTELGLFQSLQRFLMNLLGYYVVPDRTLIYFWANRVQEGSAHKGPVVDWQPKVAVRSGSTHVGTWVTERRNVLKDYQTVFGSPPPPVTNVSIITETNNTREMVTAYYGDILFRFSADSLIGPPLKTEHVSD